MLVVACEASAFHDPCEGALDDPASAQDDEAFHPGHTLDDLQRDVGLVPGPFDEASSIAGVREDLLDKGKTGTGLLQNAPCPVTILDVCGVDLDREQAAIGIGQDVALASVDLLARVVAFESPF